MMSSPREDIPVVDRSINRPVPPPPAPAPVPQVEITPLDRPQPITPQEYSGSPIPANTRPAPELERRVPEPAQAEVDAAPPADSPPAEISRQGNQPIVALLDSAANYVQSGELDKAGAALERALRIEPRNASIWHDLGQIRLHQRQYQQAESLASKSNSLAGNDRALRARNWRLIAVSRRAMGNSAGADAAEAQAVTLAR